ncbi:MAG: hypothetical protein HY553_21655 [Elusimicrobia bacterium]|nr:hypothetical protein [Elusimicrobiota bacterium]
MATAEDRRRARHWLAAALLAAGAAAYFVTGNRSTDPLARAPDSFQDTVITVRGAKPGAVFPAGRRTLTLRGLLELLTARASSGVAERVLGAIRGNAVLKRAYDQLAAERGEDAPLDDFLDRVRGTEEYRAEAKRLLADREVRGALSRVGRETGVEVFVDAAEAAPFGALHGSSSLVPPVVSAEPAAVFAPVREAGRTEKASGAAGFGKSSFGGAPGAKGALSSGRSGSHPPPLIETAKDGAHAVEKLAATNAAGSGSDVTEFLSSTFLEMPKGKRDLLLRTCENDDVCDIPTACVRADLVPDCRAACAASPKCGDDFPRALEAAVARAAAQTTSSGSGTVTGAGSGTGTGTGEDPPPREEPPAERTYNGIPLSAWNGLPFITREQAEEKGWIIGDADGQIFTPQEFGVRPCAVLVGSPLARALTAP